MTENMDSLQQQSKPQQNAGRLILALVAAGVVSAGGIGAWVAGVTPASQLEREFIQMTIQSDEALRPPVQAALKVASNAIYLSRQNFCAVADAVTGFPNC